VQTLIAGAGAVGGYFGYVLARAGWPITLLARGATCDAIAARGLRVHSKGEEHVLRLPVIRDLAAAPAEAFELVFATVKMPDLPALAGVLHRVLAPDGLVVALQNGLGAEQILAAELGAARVVGGVAYIGVDCPAPGAVRHLSGGRVTLATLPGIDAARAARLSLHLEAAGIPSRLADDLRALRWRKLVWNAAFNPVTALARVTVGEAASDPGLRAILRGAMEEVVAVARAEGIDLPEDFVERSLEVRPEHRSGITSMLQDALTGRRTEVEAIVGAVLHAAAERHIPTPTLGTLYSLARRLGPPHP
jgi:2-dehydropantoate 2-reductase